jgi:glutathione-regulated potassium-efflux system ancillary protein KefC
LWAELAASKVRGRGQRTDMLTNSAIFLGAAVVSVPLFKRLGLGTVLGYLAAGIAIGPSGLGLIHEVHETLEVAEFGVVLLLFLIGLELRPARLLALRSAVFGLGGAQVLVTAALIGLAALAFGASFPTAIVAGIALSMSSTAFATQVLGEKQELSTRHGRAAFGVLLFQDLAAIPALALLPLLGPADPGASSSSDGSRALLAVAVILGVILVGRVLLRPVLRVVANAKSHELSAASALLVVVLTSLVMQSVGLSMALGAFLAGVLLADSEYRHELEANIEPFKGLLLGLFFIAVGMSANLSVLVQRPFTVVGLVLGLVALKFGVLYAVGRVGGMNRVSSASLGVAISQGGEFAFVLFGVARTAGVTSNELTELLVVVVTMSMAVTPVLFLVRDRVQALLARRAERLEFDTIPDEGSQVIIAGFGRFGQIIARVLRLKRIPFTALDVNPTQVDFVRRFGNKIYYGDASRVDLLRAARADRARVFVLAIDDVEASMRTLSVVQENFPNLEIVARARNRQHAYALLAAGVSTVIRENFSGSVEAARAALEKLGVPSAEAERTSARFAAYDEEMVRRSFVLKDDQEALISAAKQYSAELERLFEEDARKEAADPLAEGSEARQTGGGP